MTKVDNTRPVKDRLAKGNLDTPKGLYFLAGCSDNVSKSLETTFFKMASCKSSRETLTAWMLLLVSLMLMLGDIEASNQNPCPSLNTEVNEDVPTGTVLFTFTTDATELELVPQDPDNLSGFLDLIPVGDSSYSVVLRRSLNLNVLNPPSLPLPQTDEHVVCRHEHLGGTQPSTIIRSIEYDLLCTVGLAQTTVQVQSDVRVVISDVNDNAPQFLCAPYSKAVNEMTPVGTTVFTMEGLATDLDIDGGISSYSLASGGEDQFAISGAASEGHLLVSSPLDYDHGQRYFTLNITVTDTGEPPRSNWTILELTVMDGDDQPPLFDHHICYLGISEQDPATLDGWFYASPSLVARDLDYDINATVAYTIDSGHIWEDNVMFSINSADAAIRPLRLLNRTATLR